MNRDALALLSAAGAHRRRHSGRTLFAHLVGTYAMLARAGYAPHVCLAGLFHSIYGTNAFRHQSLPLVDRGRVRLAIGLLAERLAYLFCTIDRPGCIREALSSGRLELRARDGSVTSVDRRTIDDLAAIEVANLLEQGAYKAAAEFEPIAERLLA